MIRKSMPSGYDPMGVQLFSEKIMLNQKPRARRRFNLMSLRSSRKFYESEKLGNSPGREGRSVAQIEIAAKQALVLGAYMVRSFVFRVLFLASFLAAPAAYAQGGGDPVGTWLTQAGDAKVKVTKCGGGLCGVIVWLRQPIDPATAKPAVDDKNPNRALATRPIIGLSLFSGMQPNGPNKWSGQIYNADDGNSYASNISVAGPETLRVEGCVGSLCGGENWTRSR
jgi:uncharacterized protein (DUF2147 family)